MPSPGDRAQGWLAQRRSEVMARNGMVATSQPLAAEAGLDVLRRGGNAIDAAVAASAVLSVVEPMNVGPGGDLFAVIYVARERKVYALNASGKAPAAQTLARMKALGYQWDPKNWGPGSGMPGRGILTVTVPGSVWGWDEALRRFGTMTLKETLQPAIDYAEQGFPISERIAHDWRLTRGGDRGARRRAQVLHRARSGLGRHLVYERAAAGRRSDPTQPRPGQDLPPAAAAGPRRLLQGRGGDRPSSPSRQVSAD